MIKNRLFVVLSVLVTVSSGLVRGINPYKNYNHAKLAAKLCCLIRMGAEKCEAK